MGIGRITLSSGVVLAIACGCGDSNEKRANLAPRAALSPAGELAQTGPLAATPASATKPAGQTGTANPAAGQPQAPAEPGEGVMAKALRHIAGPALEDWQPIFRRHAEPAPESFTHVAVITALEAPLYPEPGARWPIGTASIGNRLPAQPASAGACKGGQWYMVSGGAYLCSGDGAHVEKRPLDGPVLDPDDKLRMPTLSERNPFDYGKARDNAPLFARLPTAAELAAIDAGEKPDVVAQWLDGTFLLAVVRKVEAAGEEFYETIPGRYVRARDFSLKPDSPMHGEHLAEDMSLPIAFARREATLYCLDDEAADPCGTVEKHARFPADEIVEKDGASWILVGDSAAVRREDVRIVERIARPDGVGADDKWVHINLTEQAITAYEGDKPVFATLISSGKPGHDTPTGLYRVERKYLYKTMRGTDKNGPYSVQEVPWTMYFHGAYAVHGAYWHDVFGESRSHGCVNVPPADARWLFHWADLDLPAGWSSMYHRQGIHVYITGKTPPPPPDASAGG